MKRPLSAPGRKANSSVLSEGLQLRLESCPSKQVRTPSPAFTRCPKGCPLQKEEASFQSDFLFPAGVFVIPSQGDVGKSKL